MPGRRPNLYQRPANLSKLSEISSLTPSGEGFFLHTDQVLASLVQRWAKYVKLSAEDRAAMLALPARRKEFGKDAYLVREGQQATECTVLLTGFAFRQKLLRNGARQILSFHIPGEFIDLQ